MSDIVRVVIAAGDHETKTLAQLDVGHAKQYIKDIQRDSFDGALLLAITNLDAKIKKDQHMFTDLVKYRSLVEFKEALDSAIFATDGFKIVPCDEDIH